MCCTLLVFFVHFVVSSFEPQSAQRTQKDVQFDTAFSIHTNTPHLCGRRRTFISFLTPFYKMMRTIFSCMAVFAALTLISGCSDRIATIKVTGTITLDGQPLAGANVNFSPKVEGEGNPGFGVTDANGRYTLQTLAGAADAGTTPGEYLVTVTKTASQAPPPTSDELEEMERSGIRYDSAATAASLVPPRYGRRDESGLTALVEKGKQNVFNFDLVQ